MTRPRPTRAVDLVELLKDPDSANRTIRTVIGTVVCLWLLFAVTPLLSFYLGWDVHETGPWGDTFGALNTLFSGLAMAGVLLAIALQHKDLGMTRQQLEKAESQVQLTREQLAVAKAELTAAAEDRRVAEAVARRQAEAQIIATRISATNAIAAVLPSSFKETVTCSGGIREIDTQLVYLQYSQILLHHINLDEENRTLHGPDGCSMHIDYLLLLCQECERRCQLSFGPSVDMATRSLARLSEELYTLQAQPYFAGTEHAQNVGQVCTRLDSVLGAINASSEPDDKKLLTAVTGIAQARADAETIRENYERRMRA